MSCVIFLDCDGVLANSKSQLWDHHQSSEDNRASFHNNHDVDDDEAQLVFDPLGKQVPLERRCVQQLARVIQETGAKIVLTTMWRHYPDMRAFLVSVLESFGMVVLGDTPSGPGRAHEILAWLKENAATQGLLSFAILDDKNAPQFQAQGLGDRFVETVLHDPQDPSREGLTPEKANRVIDILRNSTSSTASMANRNNRVPSSAAPTRTAISPTEGGFECKLLEI